MRAVVYDEYGSFDVLSLRDIPKPSHADDQVLVRVRAAGLHAGDCFCVRGRPFPVRFVTGLIKPKYGVPGFDLAGTIEAVGKDVKRFRPGDEVFGASAATCAEYALASEDQLELKPSGMSFEQAGTLATSGSAALHGLRDVAKVAAGQKVLINGASGGVGHFAVQIAKSYGAEVTGVCSSRNLELVRSLGADHVVDYTKEDFTRGRAQYDVVLDNMENRTLDECRRALTSDGMLVLNSGTGATGVKMLVRLVKPFVVAPFVRHKLRRYVSSPKAADLTVLKHWIESGKLTSVIDRTYPLRDTAEALRYVELGHARGKVAIVQLEA